MALTQLPSPYGLDWQDWVDTVVGFNDSIRNVVDPDLPWREFAARLAEFESSSPQPDLFATWEDWAAASKLAYPD